MESILNVLKCGEGPSSSHSMGPAKAARIFLDETKNASFYEVDLYGSLALTGKGHLTDNAILKILGNERTKINFRFDVVYDYHPNGMKFYAYNDKHELIKDWLVFSVGGGEIKELNEDRSKSEIEVYKENTIAEIIKVLEEKNIDIIEYIKMNEGDDVFSELEKRLVVMKDTIIRGIKAEGLLPGPLKLKRKAKEMYQKYSLNHDPNTLLFALALATSEENASGGVIVTAPTCGASGVVPAVLFKEYFYNNASMSELAKALGVCGLICDIVKTNGSISGAEVGCQGEVGVACSAAAAGLTYLKGGNIYNIEYASEIALEHHLGMTCDPIEGLVQIPCIERNAMAAQFAISCSNYALLSPTLHYVSFDSVIQVMMDTGKDLNSKYRETSTGGLALKVRK